jgi:hypothetical protein
LAATFWPERRIKGKARIDPMRKLLLLMTVVLLVAASGASACEVKAVKVVGATAWELPTLAPVPEFPEIVTLTPLPEVVETEMIGFTAKVAALRASVTVESDECRGNVVVTVVRALGKALLKGIAVLIQRAL